MEWQKIISLYKKIKHELIIMDKDDTYVVMNLSQFNSLLDQGKDVRQMSEDELINQINQQVADWRASQDTTTEQIDPKIEEKSVRDDDTFYIEPLE